MIFASGTGGDSGGARGPSIRVTGSPRGGCVFPVRRLVNGWPRIRQVLSPRFFCSVSVSGLSAPMVMEMPSARQSSSARSIVGRCPLRSRERNEFDGRRASRAASSLVMPWCFSAFLISEPSRSVAERFMFRRFVGTFRSPRPVAVRLVRGGSALLCGPGVSRVRLDTASSLCGGAEEKVCLSLFYELSFLSCFAVYRGRPFGAAPRSFWEGPLATQSASAVDLLASIRAQQGQLQTRRSSLESELATLNDRASRLAAAVLIIEEILRATAVSASSGSPPSVSLAGRILDAIASSGSRRRDILNALRPLGFKEAAIDSAVTRLKERGLIRREGPLVFRVGPPSVPASSSTVVDPSRSLDVVAGGGRVSVDPARTDSGVADGPLPAPVSGAPVASSGSAPADGAVAPRTLRDRVREVVETSGASTRQELLAHFEPQGVRASSVDTAVSGLCKLGVLRRGPVGAVSRAVSVVSDRDESRQVEAAARDDAGSG